MDEALVDASVDFSGRAFLGWSAVFTRDKVGEMDTELFEEFFRALARNAAITLHVTQRAGQQRAPHRRSLLQGRRPRSARGHRDRSAGSRINPLDQGVVVRTYTAHLKSKHAPSA